MTPKQLRERALEKIASARVLLDAGKYDDASENVGYAAEFALKARYCTTKGWSDFPHKPAEARKRGAAEIITHDLDDLLTMTGRESLRWTLRHIDWDRLSNWSATQRYTPLGSISPDHAKAQVEETQKLCVELALFEIVERLLAIEIELANSKGPFNLFALAENIVCQGWGVVMSAWWLEAPDKQAKTEAVGIKIQMALDEDLLRMIGEVVSLPPANKKVQAFHVMGNGTEHAPRAIASGCVVHCPPICEVIEAAFVITSKYREQPADR